MDDVKENYNNLKFIKQNLIELETNKNILNYEIQNQKSLIYKLETEEEKKFTPKNLVNYIVCCLPNKVNY